MPEVPDEGAPPDGNTARAPAAGSIFGVGAARAHRPPPSGHAATRCGEDAGAVRAVVWVVAKLDSAHPAKAS
jgi:hypothetical protein